MRQWEGGRGKEGGREGERGKEGGREGEGGEREPSN